MTDLSTFLNNAIDTGLKVIKSEEKAGRLTTYSNTETENLSLVKIGKPSKFTPDVDADDRIRDYIESKMNVIDLIPCEYSIPLTKALEGETWKDRHVINDALKPVINYPRGILEFRKYCESYKLPSNHGGLRLFLTDDTTATDEISNSYQDNWLSSKFNMFSNAANQIQSFGRSVSSTYEQWVKEQAGKIRSASGSILKTVQRYDEEGKPIESTGLIDIAGGLGNAAVAAATIIASGNKLALPKVWSDSNYSPNFNAVVKLVSPYGHPEAIQEFIIKPLMYLLILSGAKSSDGISYGQGSKMTVKAYGITNMPLAAISSMSLRKGGADTSYNIYRQPLSIDVSLTFQSLIPGFALEQNPNSIDQYSDPSSIAANQTTHIGMINNTFYGNMGTVVNSIKPVTINKIAKDSAKATDLPIVSAMDYGYDIEYATASAEERDKKRLEALQAINEYQTETIARPESELVQQAAAAANDVANTTATNQSNITKVMHADNNLDNVEFLKNTNNRWARNASVLPVEEA